MTGRRLNLEIISDFRHGISPEHRFGRRHHPPAGRSLALRDLQDRIDAQSSVAAFLTGKASALFGDRSSSNSPRAGPYPAAASRPAWFAMAVVRPQSHEQLSGVSQKQHSHLDTIDFAYAS